MFIPDADFFPPRIPVPTKKGGGNKIKLQNKPKWRVAINLKKYFIF
jgi:hypothetical protein